MGWVRTVGAEAVGDLEPAAVAHVDVAVVLVLGVVQHRVLLNLVDEPLAVVPRVHRCEYFPPRRAIKRRRPLEATPKLYCERESDRHASERDVAALLRIGGGIADRARCAPAVAFKLFCI